MTTPPPDPYRVLGLAQGASVEQVQAAFLRLAKKWHPDCHPPAERAEAEAQFKRVAAAYEWCKQQAVARPAYRSPPPSSTGSARRTRGPRIHVDHVRATGFAATSATAATAATGSNAGRWALPAAGLAALLAGAYLVGWGVEQIWHRNNRYRTYDAMMQERAQRPR
ncbi:hypothetical protein CDCA_CDCA16G4296 [Cyanidium caldarium]|uniref:J domain-containing protein n=1 Tax=Cyanidium caldarium TaxID=2771 RepID=A0AAV9J1W3_CYACA|nr:hypothetical protein CDCA_CDCA16G4296 [Cyanidium caldarium]